MGQERCMFSVFHREDVAKMENVLSVMPTKKMWHSRYTVTGSESIKKMEQNGPWTLTCMYRYSTRHCRHLFHTQQKRCNFGLTDVIWEEEEVRRTQQPKLALAGCAVRLCCPVVGSLKKFACAFVERY